MQQERKQDLDPESPCNLLESNRDFYHLHFSVLNFATVLRTNCKGRIV